MKNVIAVLVALVLFALVSDANAQCGSSQAGTCGASSQQVLRNNLDLNTLNVSPQFATFRSTWQDNGRGTRLMVVDSRRFPSAPAMTGSQLAIKLPEASPVVTAKVVEVAAPALPAVEDKPIARRVATLRLK